MSATLRESHAPEAGRGGGDVAIPRNVEEGLRSALPVLLPAVLLSVLARRHFLLFHAFVEMFCVATAWAVFLLAWNTRRFASRDALFFLGGAYLLVGVTDLLHTLAYKGMGIFPGEGADLPTRLWLAARFVEAPALLAYAALAGKRVSLALSLSIAGILWASLLASIFVLDVFPSCFREGYGLTSFKIAGEYAVMGVLLGAMGVLYRRRKLRDPRVCGFVMASLAATVLSEGAFTLYRDVYGVFNHLGHLFKLASFVFLYQALVVEKLSRPLEVLFGDLKRSEQEMRSVLDCIPDIVFTVDRDFRIGFVNRTVEGIRPEEVTGTDALSYVHPDHRSLAKARVAEVFETKRPSFYKALGRGPDDAFHWYETRVAPMPPDSDGAERVMLAARDVTSQHEALARLRLSQFSVDHALDGVHWVGPDGRIVYANQSYCEMTGYAPEDLVGCHVSRIAPGQGMENWGELWERLLREGSHCGEYLNRRSDGMWVPVEVRARYLVCEEREYACSFVRNITERKVREAAVKRSEGILSALAESANLLLVSKGWEGVEAVLERIGIAVEAHRAYVFENRASADGNLLTSRRFQWHHPSVSSQINNPSLQDISYEKEGLGRWCGLLSQGTPFCSNIEDLPRGERSLLEGQGIRSIAVFPVFVGDHWWGFIGFDECADKRDWHAAEIKALGAAANLFASVVVRNEQAVALESSEERYRNLFEQSNDAVFIYDEERTFHEVNQRACDLLGYTREELLAMRAVDCHPRRALPGAAGAFEKLLAQGHVRFETEFLRKDGAILNVEISARPVSEGSSCYQGIVRDVTERKRLEAKLLEIADLERKKLGQELHDGLCQDLKGLEVSATLLEDFLEGKDEEAACAAGELASRANRTVRAAYAAARGLLPVGLDARGLPSALEGLARQVRDQFGMDVQLFCQECPSIGSEEEAHHLYRIVQEALRNAAVHGGAPWARVELLEENGGFLLTVRDTGCGFPPGEAAGGGMGIPIMRFRAQSIGAALDVLPALGGGTVVACHRSPSPLGARP